MARPTKAARARAKAARAKAPATPAAAAGGSWKALLQGFALPSLILNVIVVTLVIAVALVALLVTGSSFVALPATIAQLFLVTMTAPVASRDTALGVVPLLPGLIVCLATARRVRGVIGGRITLRQLGVLMVATIGIPLLLTLVAAGMLLDAATVLPVGTPPMGQALGRVAILEVIAFVAGGGVKLCAALARKFRIPEFLVHGIALGAKFLTAMLIAWFVLASVALGLHWSEASTFLHAFSGAPAWVGNIGLAALYIPTAAVVGLVLGSLGYILVGDTFVALGQETILQAPLPPMLWFAAVPQHSWEQWQRLGLAGLVGVVIAAVIVYRAPRTSPTWATVLGQLFTALVSIVVGLGVLLFFTVGQMGVLGTLSASYWPAALSLASFFAAGALIALFITIARDNRRTTTAAASTASGAAATAADAAAEDEDVAVETADTVDTAAEARDDTAAAPTVSAENEDVSVADAEALAVDDEDASEAQASEPAENADDADDAAADSDADAGVEDPDAEVEADADVAADAGDDADADDEVPGEVSATGGVDSVEGTAADHDAAEDIAAAEDVDDDALADADAGGVHAEADDLHDAAEAADTDSGDPDAGDEDSETAHDGAPAATPEGAGEPTADDSESEMDESAPRTTIKDELNALRAARERAEAQREDE
ncbi:hypothetical protein C1Y63_08510 [Corynebacterium sp. 13CS0277]|uniref:hypothetical protein n=1 Tax=Corynebacterium sp. 13CS0277 TaxID=2071994 RepID=UPI000D0278D1|nr:hypothetical protein [Corynebacterium sp. 13CS0277]PRQ11027.1 hypothetical protein C1Y63_08510 [Corynebacterium sp. 13CS0277]